MMMVLEGRDYKTCNVKTLKAEQHDIQGDGPGGQKADISRSG